MMAMKMESFVSGFDRVVSSRSVSTAVVDARTGREMSFAGLSDAIDGACTWLAVRGVSAGDTMLCALPNSLDAMVLFLAAMRAGIDYAPLPPKATGREIAQLAAMVRPKLAVHGADPAIAALFRSTVPDLATEAIEIGHPLGWNTPISRRPAAASRAARILLSTSGTTGEPKAMVFDVDRLWNSARAFGAKFPFLTPESRFFNILPMSYLGGLFNLIIIPFANEASVALGEPFSGRSFLTFWQDVERLEVNLLWFVPTMLRGLLALADRTGRDRYVKRRRQVRHAFLGTAPVDLATKQRFETTFDIELFENFALSETTFLTSEDDASRTRRIEGSVGAPLDYIDLRLGVRPDPDNATAEIEVRSPFAILGYLAVDGSVSLPTTADGFFRTGDLGQFAEDGQLVIGGRSRDIIKKGGLFVSMREIEVLAKSFPGVREAVAAPIPHDFYGEDYVLFIMPESEDGLVLQSLRTWLHGNVVNFKWPHDIRIVTDVPRTASGKVRKSEVARLYLEEKRQ